MPTPRLRRRKPAVAERRTRRTASRRDRILRVIRLTRRAAATRTRFRPRTARSNAMFRAAAGELLARMGLARAMGFTFGGRRDMYTIFGYDTELTPAKYRLRYERNEIAARVVETFPKNTWRGGGELVEVDDPTVITPFEQTWHDLDAKHNIWTTFLSADILAGLGPFSVIFLGAPGEVDQPLENMPTDQLAYLAVYGADSCTVDAIEEDIRNPRFGQPVRYKLVRTISAGGNNRKVIDRMVHYSRVIHIADGTLEDKVFGLPRLQRIWNRLDDLDKLAGGGSEAFFRRADAGMQLDVDPEIKLDEPGKIALQEQVEKYVNGYERIFRTRGVSINQLGSDVANFGPNVDSIIGLICAGCGIPQRILLGSERGELASSQDKSNFDERVQDRREGFAEATVVRPFVARLMELNALPRVPSYDTWWPAIKNLTQMERADIAETLTRANANSANAGGGPVVTEDEIRDLILDLPALDETPQPRTATGRKLRLQFAKVLRQKWPRRPSHVPQTDLRAVSNA
jgi:uncharacterized protein